MWGLKSSRGFVTHRQKSVYAEFCFRGGCGRRFARGTFAVAESDTADPSATPVFLSNLVVLTNFMRLSLLKPHTWPLVGAA
jgi:hypothetical protein